MDTTIQAHENHSTPSPAASHSTPLGTPCIGTPAKPASTGVASVSATSSCSSTTSSTSSSSSSSSSASSSCSTSSASTTTTVMTTSGLGAGSCPTPTSGLAHRAGISNGTASSQNRRPPRKSTLTQQQKNQKRQRATQDQLLLLELEFNKNPTPTAAVRERIASEINMTERSVQIWFQNRRAKIKLLAKKSIETGEDCDAIPESYRNYLAMQALESGKPLSRGFLASPMATSLGSAAGPGGVLLAENHAPQKVVIQHFQCRSLTIGSWRRVGQNAMDLVIFYSLGDRPCLTYYINNESAGYKIEFPFSHIKNITLENGQPGGSADQDPSNSTASNRPPGLLVELNRPPNFFMDDSGSGGFYQCGDFTENQQASRVLFHHLGGDPRVLSGQLAKLTLLDSFQNRNNPLIDPSAAAAATAAVSAPVSPVGHRPASQPNSNTHPPSNLFDDPGYGLMLQPPPRGHKRTRSRSVPAITDFSFLHQSTPSFHIQHPSTTIADPGLFAPVPQHAPGLHAGHHLRINTNHAYGLDFRQYPMSAAATTTNSPSEYASPGFFASTGPNAEPMPSAPFNPSYGLPFLSPMTEHPGSVQPSVSPLSAVSHGDPVIADHSPPLNTLDRSASVDFLDMNPEHASGLGDDSLMLSEMYSKQTLNLPIRSPAMDESRLDIHLQEASSADEIEMQNLLSFATIDPSELAS